LKEKKEGFQGTIIPTSVGTNSTLSSQRDIWRVG